LILLELSRYLLKQLLTRVAVLVLFLSSCLLHADINSKTVNVWALSIYGVEITQNYLRPFFEDMFQSLGSSYSIAYGNDVRVLKSGCDIERNDLVLGSYNRDMQNFEHSCGYRLIAMTDQSINMYVRSGTSLNDVKSLALIQGVRAGDILIADDKSVVYYTNHVLAILALYRGEIDGVVSSETGVKPLLPSLGKKIEIAYTFKEKGHAVALMSPSYFASAEGKRLRSLLLSNREKSVEVFVDGMGLGRWREP